jgi:hypothetical protein
LARESQILRQGNGGRQNKTKQNQTKPNQTSLLQTAASSSLPAGWLAWLAPPAHPAVDGTAEEPNGSGTEQRDRRGAAAAERQEQQQEQQQKQQISQSFARHHPSFIPTSLDIIHLSW